MRQRETSADIDAAAAEWVARIDAAPIDETLRSALDAWLSGDSRRLGAYARARAMLAHAARLKAFGPTFDPDEYVAEHRGGTASIEAASVEPQGHRVNRRLFLLGGGATVAAGIAAFSLQAAAKTYKTALGEVRLVPLADGSSMTLNTASSARVHFSDTMRHVELLAGEALFDVTNERHRPFIVDADDTSVRGAGTSFVVRRLPRQSIEVMVRQGSVDILRTGSGRSARHVAANMRAVSAPVMGRIVTSDVAPSEVVMELAWREGMLSFEDVPLHRAADQFARYSSTRIAFADAAIGNETVTGLFAANDPAGFARSVALSLGLKADTDANGVVLHR